MHGSKWGHVWGSRAHSGKKQTPGVEHQGIGWDIRCWQDGDYKGEAWGKDMVAENSVDVDSCRKVEIVG